MVCPQDIVPEFLQSKINRAAMFFLERWGFLLETPPNKLFLFNHFLIVLSLTLIFNMLTDACKVWTVAVGQICTWGQLLGYSLLERLEAVLNVFPQWITFSHCRMIVWKQPYNPSLDGQQQLLMSFLLGSLSNQACLDSRAALLPLNSYKGVLRFPHCVSAFCQILWLVWICICLIPRSTQV